MTVQPITAGGVRSAIQLASSRTGVDFDYLLGQAKLESGLNARARAGTSSASGLYQFIEQSWLGIVKQHGAEHGLGWAADSIHQTAGGHYTVDAGSRAAVLDLRNDPTAASLMAAEHASDNRQALETSLGRDATGTDLYMAHFLGLGGARKFLRSMQSSPDASAAALFPSAAAANRNVFYDGSGKARSLAQVYDRFAAKLGDAAADKLDTARANLQFAAQSLDMDGATVVTGGNESAEAALTWANGALGKFAAGSSQAASLLRPTPDTARLAYMMLASMGG